MFGSGLLDDRTMVRSSEGHFVNIRKVIPIDSRHQPQPGMLCCAVEGLSSDLRYSVQSARPELGCSNRGILVVVSKVGCCFGDAPCAVDTRALLQ